MHESNKIKAHLTTETDQISSHDELLTINLWRDLSCLFPLHELSVGTTRAIELGEGSDVLFTLFNLHRPIWHKYGRRFGILSARDE